MAPHPSVPPLPSPPLGRAESACQGPYRVVAVGESSRILLTGPEHAALDDATLIEVALDQARRIGLPVTRESLRILWAPAFAPQPPGGSQTG